MDQKKIITKEKHPTDHRPGTGNTHDANWICQYSLFAPIKTSRPRQSEQAENHPIYWQNINSTVQGWGPHCADNQLISPPNSIIAT